MRAELTRSNGVPHTLVEARRIHCLILDDSIFDQRRIARALKRTKHDIETTEVSSLDEFRINIQFSTYDVIFVDFRLPEGSGFDALRDLAQTATGHRSKVVWVTGDMSYDWKEMHNVIGTDAFIDKNEVATYNFNELLDRILNSARSLDGLSQRKAVEFKKV